MISGPHLLFAVSSAIVLAGLAQKRPLGIETKITGVTMWISGPINPTKIFDSMVLKCLFLLRFESSIVSVK